jgi:hypothetical protein
MDCRNLWQQICIRVDLRSQLDIAVPHQLLSRARVHPGKLHERSIGFSQGVEVGSMTAFIGVFNPRAFQVGTVGFDSWNG